MSSAAHPEQGVVVDVDATTAALNQLREPQELLQQAIGKASDPCAFGGESEISVLSAPFRQELTNVIQQLNDRFTQFTTGIAGIASTPDVDQATATTLKTRSEKL